MCLWLFPFCVWLRGSTVPVIGMIKKYNNTGIIRIIYLFSAVGVCEGNSRRDLCYKGRHSPETSRLLLEELWLLRIRCDGYKYIM